MNKSEFAIYRLCWNQEKIDILEAQAEKYNFSNTRLVTGPDYFQFLDEIIKNCEFGYALVVHDDVYLPLNIKSRVSRCIKGIDEKYGEDNWGVAGNAGIEYMTNEAIRFISDPHSSAIMPSSEPVPLIAIDGNTMLLNIKNLKRRKVAMPPSLSGFHFYDTALLIESYKHDLVCVADPNLFVIHKSGGNQGAFDAEAKDGEFQNYFKKDFINKALLAINGLVEIENSLDYLKKESFDNRQDFYSLVSDVIKKHSKKEVKKVFVVVKTCLARINFLEHLLDSCLIANATTDMVDLEIIISVNNSSRSQKEDEEIVDKLKKEYDLSIIYVDVKIGNGQFPRVKAIKDAVSTIKDDESYVWLVDDDDFIFPQSMDIFSKLLDQSFIFVGDVIRFDEVWDPKETFPKESRAIPDYYITKNYYKGFEGDNHAPINSFVFPLYAIKKVFEEFELLGDYYEDYAIIMFAQNYANVKYYPGAIAGVSFHGDESQTVLVKDRSHWDLSLATFMSEMVNAGIVKTWNYALMQDFELQRSQLNRWRRVFRLAKPVIRISRRLGIIK